MLGLDLHGWEYLMIASLATGAVVVLTRQENEHVRAEYETYKLTVEGKVADAKKEGIEAGGGLTSGSALSRLESCQSFRRIGVPTTHQRTTARACPSRNTGIQRPRSIRW